MSVAPSPDVASLDRAAQRDLVRELTARSDLAAAATIALDWGILLAAAAAAEALRSPWATLVAVVVIARQMQALYELHHHAMHANLFRSKRLHETLEVFYSLPLFNRVANDRESHMEHHRTYQVAGRDDAEWGTGYGLDLERRASRAYMTWFLVARPFVGPLQWDLLREIVKNEGWRDAGFRLRMLAFWGAALLGFGLAGRLDLLLWYWVVPLFTAYPILFFWDDMMGHYNCPATGTREMRGLYFALMSTHGCNYHNVHHLHPQIPWYRMRRATALLVDEGRVDVARGFVDGMRQMIEVKP